jgi:hypothetical protein
LRAGQSQHYQIMKARTSRTPFRDGHARTWHVHRRENGRQDADHAFAAFIHVGRPHTVVQGCRSAAVADGANAQSEPLIVIGSSALLIASAPQW